MHASPWRIHAVLFDWRGTLVTEIAGWQWTREALRRTGRPHTEAHARELLRTIHTAAGQPNRLADPTGNTSYTRHQDTYLGVFADAGLPRDLALELFAVDSDPGYNTFALDVEPTLTALKATGCKIGVLSNIHFDIRPLFAAAGLAHLVDAFVLSCELGIQKPDPEIFRRGAGMLGAPVDRTLMVGDKPGRDGAAVDAGMATLLVPALDSPECERLHLVTNAVGVSSAYVG